MSNLDKSINKILSDMRASSAKSGSTTKGTYGEKAVMQICEQFYQSDGGILIHSYSYKTDKEQKGNIKRAEDGHLMVENLGDFTEIDVLYVSPFRIFPIEVKAYRAKEIRLDDAGIYGCYKTDKSPVHQNEMHCRHLYPHVFRALPKGQTDYIVPLVCLVDKANLIDERNDWQKTYIKVCTLDSLEATIREYNTPLDFKLNLDLMNSILREAMVSSEKYLPPRI